ncbi:hypothetical protein FWC63_00085 [Candidatus Saccharibacteria bacterium]|nr:hypothetical protein [Candidatus Saccharibacteria bacterium]
MFKKDTQSSFVERWRIAEEGNYFVYHALLYGIHEMPRRLKKKIEKGATYDKYMYVYNDGITGLWLHFEQTEKGVALFEKWLAEVLPAAGGYAEVAMQRSNREASSISAYVIVSDENGLKKVEVTPKNHEEMVRVKDAFLARQEDEKYWRLKRKARWSNFGWYSFQQNKFLYEATERVTKKAVLAAISTISDNDEILYDDAIIGILNPFYDDMADEDDETVKTKMKKLTQPQQNVYWLTIEAGVILSDGIELLNHPHHVKAAAKQLGLKHTASVLNKYIIWLKTYGVKNGAEFYSDKFADKNDEIIEKETYFTEEFAKALSKDETTAVVRKYIRDHVDDFVQPK